MAGKRTVVEINGRKYDANTGQMLADLPNASPVIDGFKAPVSAPAKTQKPAVARSNVGTAQNLHQKPQKTQKLHPVALKNTRPAKKVTAKSDTLQRNAVSDVHRPVMLGGAPSRSERAAQHARSEHVTKFSKQQIDASVPTVEPISPTPVDQPPIEQPMPRPQQTPEPAPEQEVRSQNLEEKKPGLIKRLSKARPRLVPAAMVVTGVLVVGGFVAYRNIPNMALRLASSRAGFSAGLPGYNPSGYGFSGPVSYSDGVVELEYSSNSDDRSYKLIQRESSWDSQSLLDNFVIPSSEEYLTFQERGLTVYVYDTSNATWVDGGIWYTVEGDSLLTSEQLLKIARSI